MDAASLAVLSGPQLCSGRRMQDLSLLSRAGPWDMKRTGGFGETPVIQLQALNLPSNSRVFFMGNLLEAFQESSFARRSKPKHCIQS